VSSPSPPKDVLCQRDALYEHVMQRGWNVDRGAFVQRYDDTVLDSSLLRMSRVGFIAPQDPMWLSTLRAMDSELASDSLVYRYNPSASPDGLRGSEGIFSLCTFKHGHPVGDPDLIWVTVSPGRIHAAAADEFTPGYRC
jgi:GH15 family glucan-1,4-alpha-glucosidase